MIFQAKLFSKVQCYIFKVVLETKIHYLVYFALLLFRNLQCLAALGQNGIFSKLNGILLNVTNIQLILVVFFTILIISILILMLGIYLQNSRRDNSLKNAENHHIIIKKICSYLFLVFRYILVFPLTDICIQAFVNFEKYNNEDYQNTNENKINLTLGILNFILFFGCFYPLTGISFWDKNITANHDPSYSNISYAYIWNIETFIYIYLPVMVFVRNILLGALPYLNTIFCLICIIFVYFHPLITFSFKNLSQLGNGLLIGIILTTSLYDILQISTKTAGQIIFFIFIILLISLILFQFVRSRISKILVNCRIFEEQKTIDSYCGQQEILFYHVINCQKYMNQLVIFLLNNNLKFNQINSSNSNSNSLNKQNSSNQDPSFKQNILSNNANSKKKIIFQQHINPNANEKNTNKQKFEVISKKIFQFLEDHQNSSPLLLKNMFFELILTYFKSKYDPYQLVNSKLSSQQLQKKVFHSPKLNIFIAQLLLLKQKNLRKSYYLIKTQQKLLKSIQDFGFFSQFQILSLLQIIENQLSHQSVINQEFNSKAQVFFNFHQNVQLLKDRINKSIQACLQFWSQIKNVQPDSQKLKKIIQKNFKCSSKVHSQYNNVIINFQGKSSLFLFQMIYVYCEKVLNQNIPAVMNPYNGILKRIKKQLENSKKQGSDKIKNQNHQLFNILHQMGVCLIQLQGQIGKISSGNTYFWNQCFQTETLQLIQQKKSPHNIYELVLPELRILHQNKLCNNAEDQYKFNFKHQKTLLYKPFSKTIQRVSLELQILPSIEAGLKMSVFICKQKTQQNSFLCLVLNQDNQFVACSQNFSDEKFQMFQLRQGNDLSQNEQLIQNLMKNKDFNLFLLNIKQNMGSKQLQINEKRLQNQKLISTILKLQNSDYKVKLKKVVAYENKEEIYNKNYYIMYLQFFNVLNIQNEHQRQQTIPVDYYRKEKHLTVPQGQQIYQKVNQAADSLSLNNLNLKKDETNSLSSRIIQIQEGILNLADKNVQKNDENLAIDKKYCAIMNHRTPKRIIVWRLITVFLIVLVNLTMIANIVISIQRKEIYHKNKTIIKSYNQLMTDTAQILIALRQYNFYASVDGFSSPKISFYIQQLHSEKDQIFTKLRQISNIFKDQWTAFQFFPSGLSRTTIQNDYVVMANYMLNSITYISESQPQSMAFPFVMTRYDWTNGLTNVQIKFLESIYNGQYICLVNMADKRFEIVNQVSEQILPVQKQLFIFPAMIGITLLVTFSLFSIIIEVRSQKVRDQIYNYLQIMPSQLIEDKICNLIQFKERNKQGNNDKFGLLKGFNTNAFAYITKTIVDCNTDTKYQTEKLKVTGKSNFFNNFNQGDSNRQMIKQQIDKESVSSKSHKKQEDQSTIENFAGFQNSLDKADRMMQQRKSQFRNLNFKPSKIGWKILFYFLICLPFITYFLVIFVGGIFLNQNIMNYMQISSELYNRKTTFQSTYLWIRQTVVYEAAILGQLDWTSLLIDLVNKGYIHQRLAQNLIHNLGEDTHLKKYLQNVQNGNICLQVHTFQPSLKYNITFTVEQCQSLSQSILTQGLKPTIVYFFQSGIQVLNNFPDPGHMSYDKRVQFMLSPEITRMKYILAYLQQIFDLAMDQYDKDLNQLIDQYIEMTVIYSIVSAIVILSLLVAITYRWKLLIKQKKQIKSIVSLISFKSILKNPLLMKQFKQIDTSFYQS